jgi:hypothetical protein
MQDCSPLVAYRHQIPNVANPEAGHNRATFLSSFIGALRPYLLGLSVVFIAFGFYQSRRAIQCNCKPSVLSQVVLWLSALIVVISILLPQAFADLIERLL